MWPLIATTDIMSNFRGTNQNEIIYNSLLPTTVRWYTVGLR